MDKTNGKLAKLNIKPFAFFLIGLTVFSAILIITMMEAGKGAGSSFKNTEDASLDQGQPDAGGTSYGSYDSEMTAVVTGLDTEARQITLFNTDSKESTVLSYTGATDIRDKFGQVIIIQQIPTGQIVEVGYQKDGGRLMKLQVSTGAWEYIGVGNLNLDQSAREIRISHMRYKYTEEVLIIDNGNFIRVGDLTEQDELTIHGIEETIWSITVTRGHGTVRLTEVDAFIGGNVSIGYEAMQQIGQDTVITVREGNFNLTVENGEYSGTKNITVRRNEETTVSLGDLGPEAVKHGRVTFTILPFGADLFIDGELTLYASPVELSYGEHSLEVALGGYVTYEGELNIDSAGKKIKIDLPEELSREVVSVEETEDGSTETGDGDSEDGNEGSETGENYNTWVYPAVGSGDEEYGDSEDEFLVDESHMIYVQSPTGASVYLNGDFIGISPGSLKKIIGNFVLTFIKEEHETMSYTIEVTDDGLDTYISLPELSPLE